MSAMFRFIVCGLVVLAWVSSSALGQPVVFVDVSANGNNDGSSWDDAYNDLQDALTEAENSGGAVTEIWVADGIHRADDPFELINGVALLGGFAGDEIASDQRDPAANETILSGDTGVPLDPSDNSAPIIRSTFNDETAVLDGFTLSDANDGGFRGAMVIRNGNPTVSACIFLNNRAGGGGGGILKDSAGVLRLLNVVFEANSCGGIGGGGLYLLRGETVLIDCAFIGNFTDTALADGGAVYSSSDTVNTYIRCLFVQNSAEDLGGALLNGIGSVNRFVNCAFLGNQTLQSVSNGGAVLDHYESTYINCLFSGNSTSGDGGAVFATTSGTIAFLNCSMTANEADGEGGAIGTFSGSAQVTLANSILWGNTDSTGSGETAQLTLNGATASVNFSIIQGLTGGLGGQGNLDLDPLFVDADGADDVPGTEDDDLRLADGSPAIDAGSNPGVPADVGDLDEDGNTAEPTPLDFAGLSRFADIPTVADTGQGPPPIVDIGAFEAFIDCNGNGVPDADDIASGTSEDCNGNGVPDECDTASGASQDCNGNGVPDECEPDSDGDGTIDACEPPPPPAAAPPCGAAAPLPLLLLGLWLTASGRDRRSKTT